MYRLPLVALLLSFTAGLSAQESKRFAGMKAGDTWDGNGLKMKFCWCPAGKFTMGSPKTELDRFKDEDQVEVTLSRGFWLGKFEVTQGEGEKLTGNTLRQRRNKADTKSDLPGEGARFPMY